MEDYFHIIVYKLDILHGKQTKTTAYRPLFKKIWARLNSFCYDMKYTVLVRWRRGQCLSPHTTPALSDEDVVPFRGLSHRGATARGVKPRERFARNGAFLQSKNVCKRGITKKKTGPDGTPALVSYYQETDPVW